MDLFRRLHGGKVMKSRFNAFHPAINFSYYIGSIALIMLFLHPIFLIAALTILIGIHIVHDRCISLQHWLFFMIITGILIFIMNPLFNERGRHLLFEILGHRVTLEATIYGGMSALSIIGVMMLFVSYNEVMTPNKLLFLFSKILPQFAILLMLTLRFIPLMRRRLTEISDVQSSKGISILHGTWIERIQKGMLYIQVLLTYSLEEAIQTADSMKARGYGQSNRTTYEYFRFKKPDLIAMVYLSVLFSINLFGRFSGYGFLSIYPILESINPSPLEIIILVCNLMFLSFPLFAELGGFVRWQLLN
jgi:energy-coupling factor transport system permease protein